MDSTALVERVARDLPFFGEDGGITLSGGEPFAQPDFTASVLRKCKGRGIHTAIETCLQVPFEYIERSLAFLDFIMFDVKFLDRDLHRSSCGVSNDIILENIACLKRYASVPLLPRVPVIPTVNDDGKYMRATARFLKAQGFNHINLVPYMRLGLDKYDQLGLTYALRALAPPSDSALNAIGAWFTQEGITCL
jgi:pyruvate formate lyase activating enzyme